MPNYKSFDDVLKELEMDEDELKRLVSEGQIRAFRDDDRMKFRSEDVGALRRARTGGEGGDDLELGETQLGGEGLEVVEEETDETLLDLGKLSSDQDFEDTGATSVPTVELNDVGGEDQDATLTEELVFDETDELGGLDFGEGDADATQKIEGGLNLEDGEVGLETEPIEKQKKTKPPAKATKPPAKAAKPALDEVDELDDLGTVEGEEPVTAAPVRGGGMGVPGPVQIQEQIKYVEIVPSEKIVWKVLTGITFLLIMLLLVSFPALGVGKSEDVLGTFWGNFGYSLFLKSPNPLLQNDPYRITEPNVPKRPLATCLTQKPTHIFTPGMEIIRSFNGYGIHSGSAATDTGADAGGGATEGGGIEGGGTEGGGTEGGGTEGGGTEGGNGG